MSRAALVVGLCLAGTTAASADEVRVAIGSFEGPSARAVETATARALRRARGVRVVRGADADARVAGVVESRGRAWVARVRVESGGYDLGMTEVSSRSRTALGRLMGRRVADDLADAIAQAAHGGPGALSGRRVMVGGFDGRYGDRAAELMIDEISIRAPVDVTATPGGGALTSAADRASVAREAGADALVSGEVRRLGRSYELVVRVYDGADGAMVSEASYRGRSVDALSMDVRRAFWSDVGRPLASVEGVSSDAAPPSSVGRRAARVDRDLHPDEEDVDPGAEGVGPAVLEVAADARLMARRMRYTDDLFRGLHGYTLRGAPALRLGARYYPGAHGGDGPLAHLGLDVRAEAGLGIDSGSADGSTYDTRHTVFGVGAHARIPVGDHELGATAGFGTLAYRLSAQGESEASLPDARYRFLRLESQARLALGARLGVDLRGAYLHVLDAGDIASEGWFPRAEAGGLEGEVGVSVRASAAIDIRLAVEVRRFWFDMNAEPGDPLVAGGAVDRYVAASLGAIWRLP